MNSIRKRNPRPTEPSVRERKSSDPAAWFLAVLGVLITATIFLSGDLNERSGVFHLLAVLWILLAAVWTLALLSGKIDFRIRCNRWDVLVYLFFGYVVVSILWNLLPGHGGAPRPSLNMLSVWLALGAAWFLFRQLLDSPDLRDTALKLVLAVVLAEALTGIYQQFVEFPQILSRFREDPVGTAAAADPSLEPGSQDWNRWVKRLETASPMGTYPLSNSLGGLLATGFVLMLGCCCAKFSVPPTKNIRNLRNGIAGILLTTVLFGFVLTKCRSGLVAVAVGLLMLGWMFLRRLNRRWSRRIVIGAVCAILFLLVVSVALPGKSLISGAKKSLGFRLEYWTASASMIVDHPVFGIGSGNFKQAYTKYKLPQASEEIADPHNFAVELAAVAGIPALILFLVPIGWILLRSKTHEPGAPAPGGPSVDVAPTTHRGLTSPTRESPALEKNRRFFFWFAPLGGFLAFFVSLYGESQISVEPIVFLLIAFPLIVLAFGEREKTPALVSTVALVVLLVHLSAAGGISATNSAILVWLLAAILLNSPEIPDKPRPAILVPSIFLSVFVVALFVVNHYGLRPLVGALSYTIQVPETQDVSRRMELLREAAKADPWSAAIQENLATESFRGWCANPNDTAWKSATLEPQEKALALSPRTASMRLIFAERLFVLYEKTGDESLRQRALELYAEAVERYPNHAKIRAPYAVALWKSGRKSEAFEQRDTAIRLDDAMPHVDQKIPETLRKTLLELH